MFQHQRTEVLRRIRLLLRPLLVAALLLPAVSWAERGSAAHQPQLRTDFRASHALRGPVSMTYEVHGAPAVGEQVTITLHFHSQADSQFTIVLRPQGKLVVHDAAEHRLDTAPGEPAVLHIKVTPEDAGTHYLAVDLRGVSAGNTVADSYLVKLRVPTGANDGSAPPEAIYLPAR